MVSYKELAKPIDEILEKEYVQNKPWSVDLKHKLASPAIKHTAQLDGAGKLNCASATGVDIGPVRVNGLLGADGSASLQTVYSNNSYGGLSLHCNVASALNQQDVREQKIDLQTKFKQDPWQLHATFNPISRVWGLAVLGRHQIGASNVAYGVDLSADRICPPTLSGAAVSYSYPVSDHVITGYLGVCPHGGRQVGKIALGVASQTPNTSGLAARYAYIPAEEKTEITLGASWMLDPKTKTTAVKAKIDQNANIATAITHKLNSNASITIGAGFKGSEKIGSTKSGNENPVAVGVKLNLTA